MAITRSALRILFATVVVTWQPVSRLAARMSYREKMDLAVETYSGYKADERPVRFELKGRKFQIVRVLDQWYGPDYCYFRIVADDGNTYVLRHESSERGPEQWTLASYRQGP